MKASTTYPVPISGETLFNGETSAPAKPAKPAPYARVRPYTRCELTPNEVATGLFWMMALSFIPIVVRFMIIHVSANNAKAEMKRNIRYIETCTPKNSVLLDNTSGILT